MSCYRNYFALVASGEEGASGTGMDAYAYEWEDLSNEEQSRARKEAIEDYDRYEAWDRGTDTTQPPKDSQTLPVRFVDKAKFSKGQLIGKSRLTPKGFKDKVAHLFALGSPVVGGETL